MSRFRGRFSYSIDPKGRVNVPAKFRSILQDHYNEHLVISHFDGCLTAYPKEEWDLFEDKIMMLPSEFNKMARRYRRARLSSAHDVAVDPQGRILIPPDLRKRAGLEDKVMFVGMINYFEIWNLSDFEREAEESDQILDQIEQDLFQTQKDYGR